MNNKSIEQRLSELEARVVKLEGEGSPAPRVQKKVSAREFLMTKKIKSETQKALVLGYYLERIQGIPSFNINDLSVAFQAAKEKSPQNMNDAVNKNVARGLLMDAAEEKDAKKAWVLTVTGEKYVEEDLKISP